MELEVLSKSGEPTGRKVELDDSVFGIEPNDHAIYLDVKRYQAGLRQGTHKSKERSEITGSRKKLRRQKGSGAARVGDIKNPIFKGGGRVFGPKPRNYAFKINKKVRNLAKQSAIAYKIKESAVTVVEDFDFETPKTKEYTQFLSAIKVNDKKVLHLRTDDADNVYLSSRNLTDAAVQKANIANTYEILRSNALVLSEGSIESLKQSLNK